MAPGRDRRTAAAAMWVLAVLATACGGTAVEPSGRLSPGAMAATVGPTVSAAASATPAPAIVVNDGEPWIAYQWIAPAGDGIFLIRPDGTGNHQLVPDMTGSEVHPDWSPDGSRLAFVRQTLEGPTELWVVGADGARAERLFECVAPCNEIHYPDWSPDGSTIYFSQSGDVPPGEEIPRTFGIARVDVAAGSVETVYSREDGVEAWQARVSPDGTQIVYAAGSEELGAAIFVSGVNGGPQTRLTDWELLAAHPDWTPDGRIVFHTYDLAIFPSISESANLYVMDGDGGNLEQLTPFGEPGLRAAQSRVAPDGAGVSFVHVEGPDLGTRRLAYLAFGAAEWDWLTDEPTPGTHPHLRPGS